MMAKVEGENWKKMQLAKPENPYGFFAFLNAWKEIQKEGMDLSPGEFLRMEGKGDGTIYGEAGYSRYTVRRDGAICFSYSLARKEKQDLAKEEGFPPN